MPRPALTIASIPSHTIQSAAGIRLEIVRNSFRPNIRLHHRMQVIGPHMRCQQNPTAINTNLPQRLQYGLPAATVEQIWRMCHALPFLRSAPRICFQQSASGQIVAPVYRARLITVVVRPVTGERNQVPHLSLVSPRRTAPLRSRLSIAHSVSLAAHTEAPQLQMPVYTQ